MKQSQQPPEGFVKGIQFTVQQLNGSKAAKRILVGRFNPGNANMLGSVSAVPCQGGMILQFVSVGPGGEECRWPLTQAEAESIYVNREGTFEIAKV